MNTSHFVSAQNTYVIIAEVAHILMREPDWGYQISVVLIGGMVEAGVIPVVF